MKKIFHSKQRFCITLFKNNLLASTEFVWHEQKSPLASKHWTSGHVRKFKPMGTIPIPIEKNLWNKNEARTKSDPDETLFFIQSIWTISTWRNRWIKSKWQNKSSINFISYIQNKQKRQNRKSIKNRLQIEKSKKRQNTIYKKKKIWYNYFKGKKQINPPKIDERKWHTWPQKTHGFQFQLMNKKLSSI